MALNPVERRLVDLCGHWQAFQSDATRRLLIWEVPDNGVRLLQCFFEVQKHETSYTTGDLFIVFDTAFENSIQYSRALKVALAGQYDASETELKQQGISPDWKFNPDELPDSATGFVRSLRSFGAKHHKTIGHLVAVLMPQGIANDDAFASWLSRAMSGGIPERLRLVVIDSIEVPRLKSLLEAKPELVYVDRPDIDALAVAQETFAQENAVGPAAVFRNYLMGLVTLVEKGSADQVKAKAADALAFARKERWADQQVVIAILVAGALLKEKRFDEAVKGYDEARHAALQTVATNHPAGQQLVLQTWFGEAGAQLAVGRLSQAVNCYEQAAIVAQKIPNLILAIEAFRMAAFCHARADQRDEAIESGLSTFEVGKHLKHEARAMTTLPLAAVDLLRILEPERVKKMEDIKHRLDASIDQSTQALEAGAGEIEKSQGTQQFRALEENLKNESAMAERRAAKAIEALAANGSERFREIFLKARNLLGTQWPLLSPIAFPRAPNDAATPGVDVGADAAKVAAS